MQGGVKYMRAMKLKFPDFLAIVPCKIMVEQEGLSEEGEPLTAFEWEGKCIYSQKAKKVLTPEQKLITLEGIIIIKGDIAPGYIITAGIIEISNKKMNIYRCQRPSNPDGTIFCTELQVY